jgi:hypothetical protein
MERTAKYVVRLDELERGRLQEIVDQAKGSKTIRNRAWILLKADEGEHGPRWPDRKIAEAFDVGVRTVERTRRLLVVEGFEAVLNLNTHKLSSLYEAFAPEEARRLIGRLEVHHTPKHGSWLNMAETELSVLSGQCLDRRIGEKMELRSEVAAWELSRNTAKCRVDWQFTTADARVKLKRLYPSIQLG